MCKAKYKSTSCSEIISISRTVYSFLFFAGLHSQDTESLLQRASQITMHVMPSRDQSLRSEIRVFPGSNTGWCVIGPAEDAERAYVTTDVQDDYAIIVFGVSLRGGSTPMAAVVSEAWQAGGIQAIRAIDDLFSAVILDRRTHEVWIASDSGGLRTLRYYKEGSNLWISPHDVPIVAASTCGLDLRTLAAFSILRMRWSINGLPLLKDLEPVHAHTYIRWHHGELEIIPDNYAGRQPRIEPHDKQGIVQLRDAMIEHMHTHLASIVDKYDRVTIDLTAGMDTRATLALLLQHCDTARIESYTYAIESAMDLATSAIIAKRCALQYQVIPLEIPSRQELEDDIARLGFFSNGQSTSTRLFRRGTIDREGFPRFTGHNAGNLKGFYYPDKFTGHASTRLDLRTHLLNKNLRSTRFLSHTEFDKALCALILQRIEDFEGFSTNPFDIYDLFYTLERNGQYGSIDTGASLSYVTNRFSVFESPALIRMAMRMPAPMSQRFAVHRTIIRRYLPQTYGIVVNFSTWMPAMDYPLFARLAKKVFEGRRLFRQHMMRSPQNATTEVLNRSVRNLDQYFHACRENPEGFIHTAFSESEIMHLFSRLSSCGAMGHFVQGHLITMDAWYRQISEAKQLRERS